MIKECISFNQTKLAEWENAMQLVILCKREVTLRIREWQDIIYICSYVNNSDKSRLKWTMQRFLKEKGAVMYDDVERGHQHRPKMLYSKNYFLGSIYSSNYQSPSFGPYTENSKMYACLLYKKVLWDLSIKPEDQLFCWYCLKWPLYWLTNKRRQYMF